MTHPQNYRTEQTENTFFLLSGFTRCAIVGLSETMLVFFLPLHSENCLAPVGPARLGVLGHGSVREQSGPPQ